MHLEIQHREQEGILILDLKGRLVLGPEDLEFRRYLQSVLDSGKKDVILNLHGLSAIDTAGFGSLVFCAENFQRAGGRVVLLDGTQAAAAHALKIETVLETYTDELAAINSFFPDRAVPRYDILEFVEGQKKRRRSKPRRPTPA